MPDLDPDALELMDIASSPFSDVGLGKSLQRVTGRVVDVVSGEPVPYVDVVFRKRGLEHTANSGGSGAYALQLGPGLYQVSAVGEDVYGIAHAPLAVGALGEAIDGFDVEVARLASITGVVVDSDGKPIAGATIAYTSISAGQRLSERDLARATGGVARDEPIATDARGKFELRAIPGDVTVEANADGARGSATVPSLAPGAKASVRITIDDSGVIAGIAKDDRGAPVAGARVHARLWEPGASNRDSREVTTGADGRFRIDRTWTGRVNVVAVGEDGRSDPLIVQVGTPQATALELVILPGRTVAGVVVDDSGAPVEDVRVVAARDGSREPRPEMVTGADGVFELSGLGTGSYQIVGYKRGHAPGRLHGIEAPAEDLELVITSTPRIRGRVVDSRGAAVRDFRVRIDQYTASSDGRTRPGRSSGRRFFDDEGRFELEVYAVGTYHLSVLADGYAPSAPHQVQVGDRGARDVVLTVADGTSVTGVVRDADSGKPVARARVAMLTGHTRAGVYTDRRGAFALEGVAPGRRSITASHPSYRTTSVGGLDITEGKPHQVDIEMTADSGDGDRASAEVSGIGVVLRQPGTQAMIVRVIPGSPAARAALRGRDVIVAIDGKPVTGLPVSAVGDRLRGPRGTVVTLSIERDGKRMEVKLERGSIVVEDHRAGVLA